MNLADELRKLTELREAGHLTEQEFADAKRRLLAETGAQQPEGSNTGTGDAWQYTENNGWVRAGGRTTPPPLPQQSPQPKKRGGLVVACVLVGAVVVVGVAISKLGNTVAISKLGNTVVISKLGNTTEINRRAADVAAMVKSIRVQADIQAIKQQLQLYENMNGFYPTTEQGLQALVTQPQNDPQPTRWYQLFKELPKDPWGSDYIYRNPGAKYPHGYDLFSAGPDRQPDTTDDDWGDYDKGQSTNQ